MHPFEVAVLVYVVTLAALIGLLVLVIAAQALTAWWSRHRSTCRTGDREHRDNEDGQNNEAASDGSDDVDVDVGSRAAPADPQRSATS